MNGSIVRDVVFIVALAVSSLLFVGLRLLARWRSKVSLGADDYWIFTCAILVIPYTATYLWGMWSSLCHLPDLTSGILLIML